PLHVRDWGAYERANRRFAEVVAAHHRPGDLVWVHDYHLMLVPQLVRELVPGARIGFFLHIPFPASDVFRTLPNRERLLEGMLGADLVGFHTAAYMRHFASSLLRILGIAVDVDRAQLGERTVRLGVFPMGIDAGRFARLATDPEVAREVSALRGSGGCALLLAIDRLDYTKGIPRRLLAFDRLLRRHPSLRERVRLIQVAVPSRTHIEAYRKFRRHVDALVGRLNSSFATSRWAPVHYVYRSLSERELVALYRAADVMLVTPAGHRLRRGALGAFVPRCSGGGGLRGRAPRAATGHHPARSGRPPACRPASPPAARLRRYARAARQRAGARDARRAPARPPADPRRAAAHGGARGQRAIAREPGALARPTPDRTPCRPWLLVAAGGLGDLGAAAAASDGVARAGARHPRAGRGPHAGIARRAQDRLTGVALPNGGPGVRCGAGERAPAAPDGAAQQPARRDHRRGEDDRGAPPRGPQGGHRTGAAGGNAAGHGDRRPRERSHRRGPVQRAAAGRGDRSRRSRVEPRPDPYCERHGGAAPARRDRGGLPVAPMTDRAGRPFQFWTRLTLTKLTGRRAVDLAELVEHLRAVPLSVVFHHTHHFLVQHQYLSPEPPNDFAFWVTNVLQEEELGERLAAIDTVRFDHLRELRDRILAVIEGYLEPRQALRTAPAGEEFHFMDAVSFVLPTRHRAASLAEF